MDNGESSYRRFLAGDNEGLYEIICTYQTGLILYLNSYVQNIHTAEDMAESTFAELMIKRPKFSGKSSFKTWLYAIGRNNALMMIRRGKVRTVPIHEGIPDSDDLPETALLKNEGSRLLYQAMKELKPEYRRALTLLYFDGLSHDEIALAMGMSKRQIYSILKHGKETLKKTLERKGISDAQY